METPVVAARAWLPVKWLSSDGVRSAATNNTFRAGSRLW